MVSAGSRHTCALLESEQVYCWGLDDQGQLGRGQANPTPQLTPGLVQGLGPVTYVSVDGALSCALGVDRRVYCWGSNSSGQLGRGLAPLGGGVLSSAQPARVQGLSQVTGLDVGAATACASAEDGKLWCWGHAKTGAMGPYTQDVNPAPVELLGVGQVASSCEAQGTSCVPTTEVCDGVDNDCDGLIDEGRVCGPILICEDQGYEECGNGLDDDCDGLIDEQPCLSNAL